jgi:hypothetical protein
MSLREQASWAKMTSRGGKLTAPADIMEQHALKNVNNCLNTNIYSYLETSGGRSSNPYLIVVLFFNTRVNLKSVAA